MTTRQPGTQVTQMTLRSADAINIPPTIRVYQNYQTGGQVGETIPIEINPGNNETLLDLQVDNRRGRVYIANAGKNRVEVYDFRNRKLSPIDQLRPRSWPRRPMDRCFTWPTSGRVDQHRRLEAKARAIGKVDFPLVPFSFNQTPITAVIMGIFGPRFVGSNGSLWSVRANTAIRGRFRRSSGRPP
jgi:hypothetical protein